MHTRRGPKALGGFDQHVLQQSSIAVSQELRADQREDGETRIQLVVVVHYSQLSNPIVK